MTDMIRATGLVKRYKGTVALKGLDLTVPEGAVLGLLGPNGAGKTTAVRILATLLQADGGHAEVAGIDVAKDPMGVRANIGLSGQYAAVDEHLTGYENLEMVGRLYGMKRARAAARAHELLERFDLADAADRPSKTYSGGMRRRLDLAGALVAAPPVLILDEPTTGLDPRSRVGMWSVIRDLVDSGATVLLTTQYLEEADVLADTIVVIDHGEAIARGTADELKSRTGGERIEVVVADPARRHDAARILDEVAAAGVRLDHSTRTVTVAVENDAAGRLATVLSGLRNERIEVLEVGVRRPTLDDVFMALTGHTAEENPGPVEPTGSEVSA